MSKRLTTEEFIRQSRMVHGDNYDYSQTEYISAFSKVLIRCNKHGLNFWQEAKSHKSGVGCPQCGIERISEKISLSHDDFLEKVANIHGETYDYSKTKYDRSTKKITITCHVHGDFRQDPCNHIHNKQGCPKCAKSKQGPQVTTEDFIRKSRETHGNKYDYSQVTYRYCHENVIIGCAIHGWFNQIATSHIIGQGCPKCGKESMASKFRKDLQIFISEAKLVHGDKYDYSRVEYKNGKKDITIGCPIHGWFKQSPSTHTIKRCGCPACSPMSTGEEKIQEVLSLLGVQFKREFKPQGCKDRGQLRYDFWTKYKGNEFLIEFDGEQHFKPVGRFGGESAFQDRKRKDAIKTKFAIDNGYKLIRLTAEHVPCMQDVLKGALEWKESM